MLALHLLKGPHAALAAATVAAQVRAGQRVIVALLPGAEAPALPAGVEVRRLSHELSWDGLLDLIFTAERVFTW